MFIKKVIFGGFIFLGGAIIFSTGMLGVAYVDIQAHFMQPLQFLGGFTILRGIILGVVGLKGDN